MSKTSMIVFQTAFVLVFNFLLIAGTVYLVAERDWSMWTFALTMLFMLGLRNDKTE